MNCQNLASVVNCLNGGWVYHVQFARQASATERVQSHVSFRCELNLSCVSHCRSWTRRPCCTSDASTRRASTPTSWWTSSSKTPTSPPTIAAKVRLKRRSSGTLVCRGVCVCVCVCVCVRVCVCLCVGGVTCERRKTCPVVCLLCGVKPPLLSTKIMLSPFHMTTADMCDLTCRARAAVVRDEDGNRSFEQPTNPQRSAGREVRTSRVPQQIATRTDSGRAGAMLFY